MYYSITLVLITFGLTVLGFSMYNIKDELTIDDIKIAGLFIVGIVLISTIWPVIGIIALILYALSNTKIM